MGDGAEAFQADLSGGTLYRVDGAEELVDFFRIVAAFKRDQAVADDLQVLLVLGLKEFQDFIGDFVVRGQRIKVRAGGRGVWKFRKGFGGKLRFVIRRWFLQREAR